MRLSQGHLNLLSTCPRKFQHTYLEQLGVPATIEQQERLTQGTRFHQLMQQWQLGLPVEPLLQADAQLQQWFTAFRGEAATILAIADSHLWQQSEHSRTLEFQGYLLTVVYDLLLATDREAKILDWKTYPRPQRPQWLVQSWQTRLYLFALAETSSYPPEQLAMTYWFFQSQGAIGSEPQSFRIAWDSASHAQTHQDLTTLCIQLTQYLERYAMGEPFPQLPATGRECTTCNFASRCFGITSGLSVRSPQSHPLSSMPDLADIQEIPL